MRFLHSRLTCRAHNRFSPSLFLWQHFGVLERPFPHHRLVSIAANAPYTTPPGTGESEPLVATVASEEPSHPLRIRRPKTNKGKRHPTRLLASIHKNIKRRNEAQGASRIAPYQLLVYQTSGDYVGVVVEPMHANGSLKKIHYPWIVEDVAGMDGVQRLNLEIERFFQYTTPNEHELAARQHVSKRVQNVVRKILPHCKLEVFGSECTGLALPTSDIDFRLVHEKISSQELPSKMPPPSTERKRNMRDLEKLRSELAREDSVLLARIRHARYPLVGFQDRATGLEVQIVASNDTSLSREIMNDYMKQYPYLRQLYIVIKIMFDVRGLTDVFRGGFGSYPLFMMIVASIKHHPSQHNNAAGALLNFLKFYANFNTSKSGISIDPPEIFDKDKNPTMSATVKCKLKESKSQPLPDYLLALRDPADETNDLGRKGLAIRHVQATFQKLESDLRRHIKINTCHSLLEPLVGTSYMLNKACRAQLHLYGKKIMAERMVTLAQKAKAIREGETEEQAAMEVHQLEEEQATEQSPNTEQKQSEEQAHA